MGLRSYKEKAEDLKVQQVLDRFAFHPATPVTGPRHDALRHACGDLAVIITELVPDGRHQSLALTALQEAMMWGNAGIACDTPRDTDSSFHPEPPKPGTKL
jgi:hypothetical protein